MGCEWLREGTVRLSTVTSFPITLPFLTTFASLYTSRFSRYVSSSSCLISIVLIQQCCDAVQWLDDKWRELDRFPVFTTIPRDGTRLPVGVHLWSAAVRLCRNNIGLVHFCIHICPRVHICSTSYDNDPFSPSHDCMNQLNDVHIIIDLSFARITPGKHFLFEKKRNPEPPPPHQCLMGHL